MADSPRLEELRRRVQADPASIAFAALAEEYRRAGKFREAVEASRAGLRYHPTYVSARVTLGRSLVELQDLEQAERELAFVLKSAPDNLAARRALGELCWQQLRFGDALQHFRTAHALAPADTELPAILQSLERELAADLNGANGKAEEEAVAVAVAVEPEPAPVAPPPVAAPAAEAVAAPAEAVVEAAEEVAAARVEVAPVEVAQAEATRVEAAPVVAAPPPVEVAPVEVEQVEAAHFEAAHFEAAHFEAAHIEPAPVDAVEPVAEFEPVEAVAFVDDHAAAPALVDEAFEVVEEEQHANVVDDPQTVVDHPEPVAVAAAAGVSPSASAPRAPKPNPALERLERFHRAILMARRRAQHHA
jgi:tetratricopeptide (TPR) repeat protein